MTELTLERLDELEAGLAKATPGPWVADDEENDGAYGSGPDARHGFKSSAIFGADDRKLFDAINSDAIMVEVEYDECGAYAWDETSRLNAALIVSAINNLPSLITLARTALSSGWREIEGEPDTSKAPWDGGEYLTFREVGLVAVAQWWPEADQCGFCVTDSDVHLLNVTHWQPLPSPPSKGGGE